MMMKPKFLTLILVTLMLAGCETGPKGVRFTEGGSQPPASGNKPKVEEIRNFKGSEIRTAILGKRFQYTRADGNGFITYSADGTFIFEDDTRGRGTGRWIVREDQFCEVFGATATEVCGDFKYTGDAYFAAKSRLVEIKEG